MQVRKLFPNETASSDRVERAKHLIEEKSADVAHLSRKRARRAKHFARRHPWALAGAAGLTLGLASGLFWWRRNHTRH